ncbi:MAG: metalloregulator ArsR/SmtB family transcription factor [Chloroflexota bacterium]|nr:metalloregulator ArsR/SmtB family transcription factor [Chloroflexota bacterium]MDQ5866345.1 metalloregulator ArsR/SmtB family transcription factor [Chloroflexota bacterium]
MFTDNVIYNPQTVTVQVALEPAINNFNSLSTLSSIKHLSGLPSWVLETASALPNRTRQVNDILFEGLWKGIWPRKSWPAFTDYIDALEAEEPTALRDRALSWVLPGADQGQSPAVRPALLDDVEAFLDHLRTYFASKKHDEHVLDVDLYREVHALLNDPAGMQRLVVDHMRLMWETVLEPEWRRVLPELSQTVAAHSERDYQGLTPLEVIRQVTGRDMSGAGWTEWGTTLVFVPSAHQGPYLSRYDSEDGRTNWVIFGARPPQDFATGARVPTRAELAMRFAPLSDDTSLQILELLKRHGEIGAQEIIKMLGLSQPKASRHLRQLSATGYVTERRYDGAAKLYRLNLDQVEDTMQGLRRFLEQS